MHSVPRPRTGEQWIFGFCRGVRTEKWNRGGTSQLQEKHLAPSDPIRSSSALSLLPYPRRGWNTRLRAPIPSFQCIPASADHGKRSSAYLSSEAGDLNESDQNPCFVAASPPPI